MPVIMCAWHVEQAWLKTGLPKVTGKTPDATRSAVWRDLNLLMVKDIQGDVAEGAKAALAEFCAKWKDQKSFMGYRPSRLSPPPLSKSAVSMPHACQLPRRRSSNTQPAKQPRPSEADKGKGRRLWNCSLVDRTLPSFPCRAPVSARCLLTASQLLQEAARVAGVGCPGTSTGGLRRPHTG